MTTHDSNMASEFLVMSILYRLGLSPILTLGNKKEIDVVVQHKDCTITIDVKGLKGTTCWPIGTKEKLEQLKCLPSHFFVFVCYRNRFLKIAEHPEIYVVPVKRAISMAQIWKGQNQYVIMCRDLRQHKNDYLNKWEYFTNRSGA